MKKLRTALTVLIFTLLLGGCAEMNAIQSSAASYGATASDQTLDAALWTVCKGSSVGSITRRFSSTEGALAWQAVCDIPPPKLLTKE